MRDWREVIGAVRNWSGEIGERNRKGEVREEKQKKTKECARYGEEWGRHALHGMLESRKSSS